jgi:hypothetical protein
MRKLMMLTMVSLCLATVFAIADDHDMTMSKVQTSPQWEKMKTLIGQWEGTIKEGEHRMPATTSYRMTGDGSAILNMMAEGTKEEMVSMFHTDGTQVMMTHYCASHNQPRMKSVATNDPNKLAFEFVDVTNAAPDEGRMMRLVYTFNGPDQHTEEWTYKQGTQETVARFDYKRKK